MKEEMDIHKRTVFLLPGARPRNDKAWSIRTQTGSHLAQRVLYTEEEEGEKREGKTLSSFKPV